MIRKIITIVIPFLAPLAAYLAWAWLTAHRRETLEAGKRLPAWQEWPWPWLIMSGAALVTASLFVFGLSDSRTTGVDYSPARYEDGKLIPGEFQEEEEGAEGVGVER